MACDSHDFLGKREEKKELFFSEGKKHKEKRTT